MKIPSWLTPWAREKQREEKYLSRSVYESVHRSWEIHTAAHAERFDERGRLIARIQRRLGLERARRKALQKEVAALRVAPAKDIGDALERNWAKVKADYKSVIVEDGKPRTIKIDLDSLKGKNIDIVACRMPEEAG